MLQADELQAAGPTGPLHRPPGRVPRRGGVQVPGQGRSLWSESGAQGREAASRAVQSGSSDQTQKVSGSCCSSSSMSDLCPLLQVGIPRRHHWLGRDCPGPRPLAGGDAPRSARLGAAAKLRGVGGHPGQARPADHLRAPGEPCVGPDIMTTHQPNLFQENIQVVKHNKILHPSVEDYFENFDGSQYLPRPWLRSIYRRD